MILSTKKSSGIPFGYSQIFDENATLPGVLKNPNQFREAVIFEHMSHKDPATLKMFVNSSEARAMIDIATKQIIPAVIKYTTVLAESITSVKAACGADVSAQTEILTEVSSLLAESKKALGKLQETTDRAATM